MATVKGRLQFESFEKGKALGMKDAILANCYACNGFEESTEDCEGEGKCPLYTYSPHGRKKGLHGRKEK